MSYLNSKFILCRAKICTPVSTKQAHTFYSHKVRVQNDGSRLTICNRKPNVYEFYANAYTRELFQSQTNQKYTRYFNDCNRRPTFDAFILDFCTRNNCIVVVSILLLRYCCYDVLLLLLFVGGGGGVGGVITATIMATITAIKTVIRIIRHQRSKVCVKVKRVYPWHGSSIRLR